MGENLLEEIGNISEDEVYQDEGKDIAIDQLLWFYLFSSFSNLFLTSLTHYEY